VAWESAKPPAQFLVTPAVCLPSGSEQPRSLWVALNRLRSGVGRFSICLYRWGILDTPTCICGAEEQSANHTFLIVTSSPLRTAWKTCVPLTSATLNGLRTL